MTASILDGQKAALHIKQEIMTSIQTLLEAGQRPPGLAVILVGEDAASGIYVRNKRKACDDVGILSNAYDLPYHTSEETLLNLIDELNNNPQIDGILVQLPLPSHIDTEQVIERIHPQKDVDGFHPYNVGRLVLGMPILRPCTPLGIMALLQHYDLSVVGKHAVIIGASNIVGRPMALELLMSKATVTICHRGTQHLKQHVESADILVVATGTPDVIETSWLHSQQIVIDVGIHRLSSGQLRGDVNFADAEKRVAWITPVPGGVGPMTICTLLKNTLSARLFF